MKSDPETTIRDAENILRKEYWDEVRDTANNIIDELKSRVKDGESGEPLREWLLEYIHEVIDGHSWVIYTAKAQRVLMFSDNDGAYVENFGPEGIVEDGSIMWSRLAYGALEADVTEQLDSEGIDLNDPENSDAFEGLREEMRVAELVAELSSERLVKLLESGSIECRGDETDDVLREALKQNIMDGTIEESALEMETE